MSYNLDDINRRRKAEGKRPLTREEARKAQENHRRGSNDNGFSLSDYMIGHVTGVPYNFSSALGSMSHDNGNSSGSNHDTGPTVSNDSGYSGGGGDFGGGGDSGSF